MPPLFARSLAATAFACLSLSPALAEDRIATSREVSYADLDLASETGIARLHQRVRSAARSICDYRGLGPIMEMRLRRDCMADVVDRASDDIALAVLARRGDRLASLSGSFTIARR